MKRISDVAPYDKVAPKPVKAAEIEGKDLTLTGFEIVPAFGRQMVILQLENPETGSKAECNTVSRTVRFQVEALDPEVDLPLTVCLTRAKFGWVLA